MRENPNSLQRQQWGLYTNKQEPDYFTDIRLCTATLNAKRQWENISRALRTRNLVRISYPAKLSFTQEV